MRKFACVVAAMLTTTATPVFAAQYVFGFDGGGKTGSGVLTTTDAPFPSRGFSAVSITGITGMINGLSISGLNNFLGSNNLYYTSGPSVFDGSGLGFSASDGSQSSLYFSSGNYRLTTLTGGFSSGNVAVTSALVAGVPEPVTWALMIVGFGMVGGAMRRRATYRASVTA